jgi:hypothetical protein
MVHPTIIIIIIGGLGTYEGRGPGVLLLVYMYINTKALLKKPEGSAKRKEADGTSSFADFHNPSLPILFSSPSY